ncbi:glycoside hydrolase family 28 protein [Parasediminibacterium paludis]|uniref:Glycoside hydrolase family 28 protein n=1 Tax=Parasediminibacterium paludis TaxID=908966 RepID=A0ABV8Q159_9BACT
MKKILLFSCLAIVLACSKTSTTTDSPVITVPIDTHRTVLNLNSDGVTNQALALQQAIDSCSAAGGGTLELPKGTYMIGAIYMKSNVTLYLDSLATLLASGNMNDFVVNGKTLNIINGTNSSNTAIQNVAIKGKGTIDGNGAAWWAAYKANTSIARPRLVYITNCTNLILDSITLQNSPSFHFVPNQCQNVIASNLKIIAPPTSPNTDGIDPSDCSGVTITNCTIDNGDDNIAVKGGRINGVLGAGCQDLTVTNCTFLHGHGLSVGSETDDGVKNLTVTNCTFNGTTNGIRLKSLTGAGGLMQNLSYSGITMTNVTYPIIIDLNYNGSAPYPADIPSVNGVTIDHLTVTGAKNAGSLVGLTNSILQNITLSNLNITAQTGLILTNGANINMSNYVINVASGKSIIATNATGTGF